MLTSKKAKTISQAGGWTWQQVKVTHIHNVLRAWEMQDWGTEGDQLVTCRQVGVPDEKARETTAEGASVAVMPPGYWRYEDHLMFTKNSSKCGMWLAWTYKTTCIFWRWQSWEGVAAQTFWSQKIKVIFWKMPSVELHNLDLGSA